MKTLLLLLTLFSAGALSAQAPKDTQASLKSSSHTTAPSTTTPSTATTLPGAAPVNPATGLVNEKDVTIPENTTSTTAPAPAGLTIWDFVRMVVVLALVIGLVVGFLWFLKKVSSRGNSLDDPIKVLHTHVLSGSKTLYLVELGTQVLLLGSGDGGVSLIMPITDPETLDAIRLASSRQSAAKAVFSSLLANMLGKKPPESASVNAPVEESSDFLKKQRERLKNLR